MVFVLYVVSILFVVVVGFALRTTLWRTMGSEPLVIDLPPYQRPTLHLTATVTWLRLGGFLRTASGIIVATVAAVWFLQAIPAAPGYAFGEVPVQDSVYARTAQAVAPVFVPAGFGTWETTSALIVGFVAKEAVISSWAQTYSAEEPATSEQPGTLGQYVQADFEASSGGHTDAAVWAFLVFLLAYTPCVATLAAQRREIGMRWTALRGGHAAGRGVARGRGDLPDRVAAVNGPLTVVLAAVESGATTRAAIVTRTGLDPDVVDGAVDHLLRLGRVAGLGLTTSCPDGGCHGCGSVTGSGCSPRDARGPQPVTVRTRSASDRP